MSVVDLVAGMLAAGGVKDVRTVPPARRDCPQPVVVGPAEWKALAEGKHVGRWGVTVPVLVVSETSAGGYTRARACEEALNGGDWTGFGAIEMDVLRVSAGMPSFVGCDSGGYWLWRVEVHLTCEEL